MILACPLVSGGYPHLGEDGPARSGGSSGLRTDGKIVTHYFTIRWRRNITADHEVFCDGQVYRIRRIRDLNSKRRFLLLECEELGTERGEGYAEQSVFTLILNNRKRLFLTGRVCAGRLSVSGRYICVMPAAWS